MTSIPKKMSAVLTTGHGGFDVLDFQTDAEVPSPNSDQVLIKVLGAGINNTCLLYTSPSPRDGLLSRMPSSA